MRNLNIGLKSLITLIFFCQIFAVAYSQTFKDVGISAGIEHVFDFGDFHFGGGVAVFDYNNDGYEDLYMTGGANDDVLYKNNGNGTFSRRTRQAGLLHEGLVTQGVVTGDINNDGFRDLFITVRCDLETLENYKPNLLYLNNGNGTFSDISVTSGIVNDTSFSTTVNFGDVNLDGYLDIYVGNWVASSVQKVFDEEGFAKLYWPEKGSPNVLFINNGDLTFKKAGARYGVDQDGLPWGAVFTDYDNDNDLDILIANDFGRVVRANTLYRNEYPEPIFSDVSRESGIEIKMHGMGIALGDYNEDGFLDYYATNIRKNVLYESNGDGTFTNKAEFLNVDNPQFDIRDTFVHSIGWGANFMDCNNDTYLDLFVTNGQIHPETGGGDTYPGLDTLYNPNVLYQNDGTEHTFSDISDQAQIGDPYRGRGSATLDYDNDGDLDIVVVNQVNMPGYGIGTKPRSVLFRNDLSVDNNWLKVKLRGIDTNTDGIGSKVRLVVNGRSFFREIDGGSSNMSQSSTIAHFGLGQYEKIDTLEVLWLGGRIQGITDIDPNQTITVVQGDFNNGFQDWGPRALHGVASETGIVTGTQDLFFNKQALVYPNPFLDSFNVKIKGDSKNSGPFKIELSDVSGRKFSYSDLSNNDIVTPGQMSPGIYFYLIKDNRDNVVERGRIIAK